MIITRRRLLALAACSALAFPPLSIAADKKPHNVVIHVTDNDPAKWNQALNNSANLQKAMGRDKVNVEIVVNGPGLDMMKSDSIVAGRMAEAIGNGVELMACGATMKAANVTEKDLHNGVKVVPSYLLKPVAVDKSNAEKILVTDSAYYTADQLKN